MPVVQPAELWVQSGRWDKYGPELLRLKDRASTRFRPATDFREVVTDIARQEIRQLSATARPQTRVSFR